MPPCLGPFFLDRDPLPVWSAAAGGAPIYSLCSIAAAAAAATVCCVVYKREKKRFIFNDQLRLVNRSELHHAHHTKGDYFHSFYLRLALRSWRCRPHLCVYPLKWNEKKNLSKLQIWLLYMYIYIYIPHGARLWYAAAIHIPLYLLFWVKQLLYIQEYLSALKPRWRN
jgi:hypothetical protein